MVGGYGESSIDILALIKFAASKAAPKHWKRMGAKDEKQARGMIIASLKRTWGTVFARSMAGVRMARRTFAGQERRRPGGVLYPGTFDSTQYQGILDPEYETNTPF